MKEYVKPGLYYENFQLSNYASGCTPVGPGVKTANDGATCVYMLEGVLAYFNQGSAACVASGSLPEDYCYQNGSEGVAVTWS